MTLYCPECRKSRYAGGWGSATCYKCRAALVESPAAVRPKPKRRVPRVVVEREPAQKFRLTREDVFRSVSGRGYDER